MKVALIASLAVVLESSAQRAPRNRKPYEHTKEDHPHSDYHHGQDYHDNHHHGEPLKIDSNK